MSQYNKLSVISLVTICFAASASGFVQPFGGATSGNGFSAAAAVGASSRSDAVSSPSRKATTTPLFASKNDNDEPAFLQEQTFGGYTVKQRLREEIESPYRTLRLNVFGFSTLSAFVALYFSLISLLKATSGYDPSIDLQETINSVGINIGAVLVCGFITVRDWKAGNTNLARIKQGGALAKLIVRPPGDDDKTRATLKDYRRNSRVVIAAGGKEYIRNLCRSLCADQLDDENTLPSAIESSEVVVVPVLLESAEEDRTIVGDTVACWKGAKPSSDKDRNFDVSRSDNVVAFPVGARQWAGVLEPEVKTAVGQGFDVLDSGITLTLKKNGKILRRATGQPQWAGLLSTMEVLDGKFGMPGDDEKYGQSSS